LNIGGRVEEIITKNISPIGMRFELSEPLEDDAVIDMDLYLPDADKYISMSGKMIWQKRTSLEDNSPYDFGVEIVKIEDENKNVLLKYLCDLLYDSDYNAR
jgi:PilZ domain-containing protein